MLLDALRSFFLPAKSGKFGSRQITIGEILDAAGSGASGGGKAVIVTTYTTFIDAVTPRIPNTLYYTTDTRQLLVPLDSSPSGSFIEIPVMMKV